MTAKKKTQTQNFTAFFHRDSKFKNNRQMELGNVSFYAIVTYIKVTVNVSTTGAERAVRGRLTRSHL